MEFINNKRNELALLRSQLQQLKDGAVRDDLLEHPILTQSLDSRASLRNELDSPVSKVVQRIGHATFWNLRDLFEAYATAGSHLTFGKLDLSQFHRLLRDFDLYTETHTPETCQILFFRKNPARFIRFERFLAMLAILASEEFPNYKKFEALEKYSNLRILPNSGIRDERIQSALWTEAIKNGSVGVQIRHFRPTIAFLYQSYETRAPGVPQQLKLSSALSFTRDFNIIPNFTTSADASRLFRSAQQSLFHYDYIGFNEFIIWLCFISFTMYPEQELESAAKNLMEMLRRKIRSNPKPT